MKTFLLFLVILLSSCARHVTKIEIWPQSDFYESSCDSIVIRGKSFDVIYIPEFERIETVFKEELP